MGGKYGAACIRQKQHRSVAEQSHAGKTETKESCLLLNNIYHWQRFVRFSINDSVDKSAAQLPVLLPANLSRCIGFA